MLQSVTSQIRPKMPPDDGLCMCGCGSPTPIAKKTDIRKGLIKGKPNRFLPGHQTRKPGLPYTISEKTGCWVWQRSVASNDYGCLGVGRKTVLAHRYFYEKYKGPIPEGMQIDHLCMNKLCVNPDHLEAVTQEENQARYLKYKYAGKI